MWFVKISVMFLLGVLYAAFFRQEVGRFLRARMLTCDLSNTGWIEWCIRITLRFLLLTLLFTCGPLLWIGYTYTDSKERKERDELIRVEAENRKARKEENERRADARAQWFTDHRPRLYYNTIDGVTAVLDPEEYVATKKRTAHAITDERWSNPSRFLPEAKTCVFVTQSARNRIFAILKTEWVAEKKICGYRSRLDIIVEKNNVELVHAPEIFVPWVNESLLSFETQRQKFRDCEGWGTSEMLVERQAPAELQSI